ncbi:uracil phosphoribosyltransferase [Rhizocola hellebori]|uniref:uracil phosphoribosyltransferase n=2 Tax=Rhizocola hellebori TaxID=1392758 RepID=A0A8J3Q7A6_9ACTN|nr:uracil phosphoribosyltransferase [Rhizocola hellebori]
MLPQTNHLRSLHTVIRDRAARREDFLHVSSRIMRLLIEFGLNLLPFDPWEVQTPVGRTYSGLRLTNDVCAVSIARAGNSIEAELRAVCPTIRLGQMLIQRDKVTKLPRLYLSLLPPNIGDGHVLLLDPMLATGGTARAAIEVLLEAGVAEEKIIFISLIAVPEGLDAVLDNHRAVRIVTSAIDERLNENAYMLPGIGDFGDRFYGTDR